MAISGRRASIAPQPPTARQSQLSVRYGTLMNCATACTPASVRPAHVRSIGRRRSVSIARRNSPQPSSDRAARQSRCRTSHRRPRGKRAWHRARESNQIRRRGHGRSQQTGNGISTKRGTRTYPNIAYADELSTQRSPQGASSAASTFLGAAAFLGAGAAFLALGVHGLGDELHDNDRRPPLRLPSFMMRV